MGQNVFMELFNLAVTTKNNVMLILKTTSVLDLHHKLCACISESRELEDKISLLSKTLATRLKDSLITSFRKEVFYIITPKGGYDINKLLKQPYSIFPEKLENIILNIEKLVPILMPALTQSVEIRVER